MNTMSIADVGIRQDEAGRFSLNDLHRAAGGENRHRPSLWVDNRQTRDLVEQLESEAGIPALVTAHGGGAPGTYAARELVYAYAMWISPAFQLQVIRAYDAIVAQRAPAPDALQDPATLRRLLLEYAEDRIRLEQTVAEQAPKVEALERIADGRGAVCLTDAAKLLQVRRADLIQWMQEHSWIYRRCGSEWVAYQPRIQSGMLTMRITTIGQGLSFRNVGQVLVTSKGLARLAELLAAPSPVLAAGSGR